jgi:primosomal protein N' (replication factor Y) (superfamily II helicase)
VLGPAPAPLYRLRGRFRRQILLKSPSRKDLRRLIAAWLGRRETLSTVRESIDIDPLDMM